MTASIFFMSPPPMMRWSVPVGRAATAGLDGQEDVDVEGEQLVPGDERGGERARVVDGLDENAGDGGEEQAGAGGKVAALDGGVRGVFAATQMDEADVRGVLGGLAVERRLDDQAKPALEGIGARAHLGVVDAAIIAGEGLGGLGVGEQALIEGGGDGAGVAGDEGRDGGDAVLVLAAEFDELLHRLEAGEEVGAALAPAVRVLMAVVV